MERMQGKIIAAIVGVVLCMSLSNRVNTQELKPPDTADFVSEILPYSLEEVSNALQAEFDSDARSYFEDYNRFIYDLPEKVLSYKDLSPKAYEQFMALPLAKPTKFYVFFGAYQRMQHVLQDISPASVIGLDNKALVRYASLPAEAKANDVYVWSPDTPYWHSEYRLGDTLLPFRTYFILHLTAVDETNTQVEVIEHKPVVRMDGIQSLDENGKLQEFELREVAPTTRDRRFLISCIRQFMDRGVPDRRKFNCSSDNGKK